MTAENALFLATLGGARAIGRSDRIGSLEVGKEADLIAIRMDHLHLAPVHDPISQIVYSAQGHEVDYVWCAGRSILEKGIHLQESLRFESMAAEIEKMRVTLTN
jgi:5-methylthioadenosine/S-adenosylhomocysteine deaminase